METKNKAIGSMCLFGVKCKPDGTKDFNAALSMEFTESGNIIPLCADPLGAIGRPTMHSDIVGTDGYVFAEGDGGKAVLDGTAKVIEHHKEADYDITDKSKIGASEMGRLAIAFGASKAVLSTNCPSCVIALEMLKRNGIETILAKDFRQI